MVKLIDNPDPAFWDRAAQKWQKMADECPDDAWGKAERAECLNMVRVAQQKASDIRKENSRAS